MVTRYDSREIISLVIYNADVINHGAIVNDKLVFGEVNNSFNAKKNIYKKNQIDEVIIQRKILSDKIETAIHENLPPIFPNKLHRRK